MEKLQFRIDTGNGSRELILDSKNFLYYAAQKLEKSLVPEEKVIEAAIDRPLGGVSLEDIPIDGKVAVIIDDATRPTPSRKIIPYLLRRVEKRSQNIAFITAPGTHRPLTEEELDKKIGKDVLKKYSVVNVDAQREEDYQYIGETEQMKTPLYIPVSYTHLTLPTTSRV